MCRSIEIGAEERGDDYVSVVGYAPMPTECVRGFICIRVRFISMPGFKIAKSVARIWAYGVGYQVTVYNLYIPYMSIVACVYIYFAIAYHRFKQY